MNVLVFRQCWLKFGITGWGRFFYFKSVGYKKTTQKQLLWVCCPQAPVVSHWFLQLGSCWVFFPQREMQCWLHPWSVCRAVVCIFAVAGCVPTAPLTSCPRLPSKANCYSNAIRCPWWVFLCCQFFGIAFWGSKKKRIGKGCVGLREEEGITWHVTVLCKGSVQLPGVHLSWSCL